MTWQQGALFTAAFALLAGASWGAGRLLPGRPRWAVAALWFHQAAAVVGLYSLWQLVLDALVTSTAGAVARGRALAGAEAWMHLPSEAWFQSLFLPHPHLVQFLNAYYADMDFPALGACLVWMWWRHRDRYKRLRLTMILVSGAAAFIQAVPFAPPRLVPGLGVVDTPVAYHQSVYPLGGLQDPSQLTSMPSVHVAWAAMVAVAVITATRSRWRWLAAAHPVLTVVAVVATGNHFWLDAVAGIGLLGAALGAQAAGRRTVIAWSIRQEGAHLHGVESPTTVSS